MRKVKCSKANIALSPIIMYNKTVCKQPIFLIIRFWFNRHKERVLIALFPALRPEYDHGISQLKRIVPLCQKIV